MYNDANYIGACAFVSSLLCAALALPVLHKTKDLRVRRLVLLCAFLMLLQSLYYVWAWPDNLQRSFHYIEAVALVLNLAAVDLMLWQLLDGRTMLRQIMEKLHGPGSEAH